MVKMNDRKIYNYTLFFILKMLESHLRPTYITRDRG